MIAVVVMVEVTALLTLAIVFLTRSANKVIPHLDKLAHESIAIAASSIFFIAWGT